jgi:hypothetical protein
MNRLGGAANVCFAAAQAAAIFRTFAPERGRTLLCVLISAGRTRHRVSVPGEAVYLRSVPPPTPEELQAVVQRISERIGRHLERQGILSRDAERSQLQFGDEDSEDALGELHSASITYRIALGPQRGRKALQLQTIPPRADPAGRQEVAQCNGFSLHAGGHVERRPSAAAGGPNLAFPCLVETNRSGDVSG